LYSNVDPVNYPETFGEGFIFIHNPLAKNPLPKNIFKFVKEFWIEDDCLKWDR